MADEDDVGVLLLEGLQVGVLVLGPFAGEELVEVDDGVEGTHDLLFFLLLDFPYHNWLGFDFLDLLLLLFEFLFLLVLEKVIAYGLFVQVFKLRVVYLRTHNIGVLGILGHGLLKMIKIDNMLGPDPVLNIVIDISQVRHIGHPLLFSPLLINGLSQFQ